jgi:cell division septation protein DedD
MVQDRREFNRFDIFVVLEFRLLRDRAKPFLGVTKNVSCEGLCIDTQCVDFYEGDELEVTLKHPEADRFVTLPGKVIWKHKGSKFASMMGITLAEADLDSRTRMLEILSAAGNMPVDYFILKERVEHTTEEEEETAEELPEEEVAAEVEMEAEPEVEEESEKVEEEVSMEEPVEPAYVHAEHVSEAEDHEMHDTQEHSEITDTGDTTHEEHVEFNLSEAVQEEMDLKPDYDEIYKRPDLKSDYRKYAVIAGIVLVLLYAFISYNSDKEEDGWLQVAEKPVSSQKEDKPSALIPDIRPKPLAIETEQLPQVREQKAVKKTRQPKVVKEAAVQTRRSVPDKKTVKNKEYIIQVGSWKNKDNARRMLTKLKKYYPDTYMVSENDLKKVRVPLQDKAQGEKIINDIERRFKVKPLLVVKGK